MTVEYAVRPWLAATLVLGTAAAAGAAARTPFPGRFLFLVVVAGAAVESYRAVLLRPTLRAHARGIEVVVGLRRQRLPWGAVESVDVLHRPTEGRALRRFANALEIDLGDRLVHVPSYRLGAPSTEVADALARLSPNGPPGP